MPQHSFVGSKAYADNLGRLVGALRFLIQWLYVLLVFHVLFSVIQAS
jgi:hypothetical protein